MPVFDNSQTMMAGSSAQSTGIDIGTYTGKSLMLNDDSSEYLNRTFGTANGDTWTFSCWIKRCKLGTTQVIFGRHGTNACLTFSAADKLEINDDGAAAYVTTNVFRDTNAWYHIVFTGNGTLNKLYVNNVLQTLDGSPNIGDINTNAEHRIGHNAAYGYADFYIAGVHFVDGQELLPEVFGHHSPDTKAWVMEEPPVAEAAASGGTESTDGQFKVHKFTSTSTLNVTQGGLIEYLVVAGGGGGGGNYGGGGGAGGFQTGTMYVPKGNYSITVGAGGDGGDRTGSTSGLDGDTGANSVFHTITSLGGGGGGATDSDEDGEPGGSGGGSRYGGAVGAGTSGQGYNGGTGSTSGSNYGSGGGGGASAAGTGGSGSAGGVGGDGIASTISGSSVTYAGGGGGGTYQGGTHGNGGSGGGGNGATAVDSGTVGGTGVAGTVNTGGGGGGGSAGSNGGIGGDGGSGIVIVRYYNPTTLDYGDNGFKLEFKESGGIERGGETEFTLPAAGTLTRTHAGNDDSSAYFDRVLTGNWSLQWTCKSDNSHSSGDSMRIGVVPATTRGSWTFTNSTGGAATNHHVLFGSGNLGQCTTQAGQDNSHSAVGSISGTFKLTREGGDTIKFYHDSGSGFALDHTFSVTSSADMVFFFGSGEKTNTNSLENFVINDDGNGNSGNFYTAAPGNDTSGETNHWNLVEGGKQMIDTPLNNFCTLNTLNNHEIVLSDGNLKGTGTGSNWDGVDSTFAVTSGKWYWEVKCLSISEAQAWTTGIHETDYQNNGLNWYNGSYVGKAYGVQDENYKITTATQSAFTTDIAAGDIIQWRLNLDDNELSVSVDGVDKGKVYDLTDGKYYSPAINMYGTSSVIMNFGQDSSFLGTETATSNTDENGYGTFHSAVPSGYLALCSANIPDVEIGMEVDDIAEDHFNTVLYTGNGTAIASGGKVVTGVGFSPDVTWIKGRSSSGLNHMLIDSVRGVTKRIVPDDPMAEATDTETLTAFGTDGFTLGSHGNVNTNGTTFVSYNWLANETIGTGDFTQGSVASTGMRNTDAGFSVILWENASSGTYTIGHGLSKAPDMMISKDREASVSWTTYHSGIGATGILQIDGNYAVSTSDGYFNDTDPTATLMTLKQGGVGTASNDMVAYFFTSIEGYSKFGKYTGNNSAEGPFVYCGFRPAFVVTKRYDSADHWRVIDSKRNPANDGTNPGLKINETDSEADSGNRDVDFVSNGFKIRHTDVDMNANNGTYVYMAFAETPYRFANAF